MPLTLRLLALLLPLVGGHALPAPAASPDSPSPPTADLAGRRTTLSGTLVTKQGRPIAEAEVHIDRNHPAIRSDSDGDFLITHAPEEGGFDLCALSIDQTLGAITHVKAGAPPATITLQPTVDRGGIASTPAGTPASGLRFHLYLWLNGQSIARVDQELSADAAGRFRAKHLIPNATYQVFWGLDENPDFSFGNQFIDLSRLDANDPLRFTAEAFTNTLAGTVLDATGKPVGGASVCTDPGSRLLRPMTASPPMATASTDPHGQFRLGRLADGYLQLRIEAPGLRPTTAVAATDEQGLRITLRGLADPVARRATVRDSDGHAVAGAAVTLRRVALDRHGAAISTVAVTTDAAGIARFPSLPPPARDRRPRPLTQSCLVCDAKGYDLAVSHMASDGEDLDVTFSLTRTSHPYIGKVVDHENRPVSGARVALREMGSPGADIPVDEHGQPPRCFAFTTGADGKFELTRIPRNVAIVVISAPGFSEFRGYFDPKTPVGFPQTFKLPAPAP